MSPPAVKTRMQRRAAPFPWSYAALAIGCGLVLVALALGARAVLIGRPVLWGLAATGAAGVRDVLELLRRQLRTEMALTGCARLDDVGESLVRPAD